MKTQLINLDTITELKERNKNLRESNRILVEHLSYLRAKLKKTEAILELCVEAVSE